MLTGEFRNAIDDKGRLLLPARLRSAISGNILVLTRGIDQCLWLFPGEEWSRISDSLMGAASPLQKKARLIHRRIIAPAQEIEIDKSGRITIPPTLKEFAGLKKEAIVLGLKKSIEIWDEEIYQSYLSENEAEFQQAAEELGDLVSF